MKNTIKDKMACRQGFGVIEAIAGTLIVAAILASFASMLRFGSAGVRTVQSTVDFQNAVNETTLLISVLTNSSSSNCSTLFVNSSGATATYNPSSSPMSTVSSINLATGTPLVQAGQTWSPPTFSINSNTSCGSGANPPCGLSFSAPTQTTTSGSTSTYSLSLNINAVRTAANGTGTSLSASIPLSLSVNNSGHSAWQITSCHLQNYSNPFPQCITVTQAHYTLGASNTTDPQATVSYACCPGNGIGGTNPAGSSSCGDGYSAYVAVGGGTACPSSNIASSLPVPFSGNADGYFPNGWYGSCVGGTAKNNYSWAVCCPTI